MKKPHKKSNAQNMPEGALPTSEELFSDMENPMIAALEDEGITPRKLAKQLKSELNAKEVKTQIPKDKSEFIYSKRLIAWDVRQKARQDAHKLRGDYPTEKFEHIVTLEDRLRAIHEKRKKKDVSS